jgi:predicted nucleic acid-binding protein
MARVVLLDSTPMGLLSHPRSYGEIARWTMGLINKGIVIAHPEIVDYELRRELVRLGKRGSIERLDRLRRELRFLKLESEVLIRAADLWAEARKRGRPTAPDDDLDVDMILAAQAQMLEDQGDVVTVASENTRHLSLFVDARSWQDISE